MTTTERIQVLLRAGVNEHVVAAIIGADVADVVHHAKDPSFDVPVFDLGDINLAPYARLDGATFTDDISVGSSAGAPGTRYAALGIDPVLGPFLNLGEVGNNANLFGVDGELHSDSHVFSDSGIWAEPGTEHDWSGVYAGFDSAGLFYSASEGLGQVVFSAIQVGEADDRFRLLGDGSLHWGGGALAPDVTLARNDDGVYVAGASLAIAASDPAAASYAIPYASLSADGTLVLSGNATIAWGDGALAPDVTIERGDPFGNGYGLLNIRGGMGESELIIGDPNSDHLDLDASAFGPSIGGNASAGGFFGLSTSGFGITTDTWGGGINQYGLNLWNDSSLMNIGTATGCDFFAKPDYEANGGSLHRFFSFGLWGEAGSRFNIQPNGTLGWNDGHDNFQDTNLQRAAPGVLEILEDGGGFKLHSPDGTQTKTLRLSNAGALELV